MMSLVQFIDGQWLAGEGKPFSMASGWPAKASRSNQKIRPRTK